MNSHILNKYGVTFREDAKGHKFSDGESVLSSYLYIWRALEDINEFISDVDKCLQGHASLVEDLSYSDPLYGIYGELSNESLELHDEHRTYSLYIPLADFKERLLSWKEFLLK